jgi:hypothetical protein
MTITTGKEDPSNLARYSPGGVVNIDANTVVAPAHSGTVRQRSATQIAPAPKGAGCPSFRDSISCIRRANSSSIHFRLQEGLSRVIMPDMGAIR